MARLYTLSDLRRMVRERADYEDDGNRITNTELDGYINRSIADLYDLITVHDDANIFAKNAPVLIQTSVADGISAAGYQLPDDFYKLLAVHFYTGGNYYEYRRINPGDYSKFAADPPDERNGRYTFRYNTQTGTKTIYTYPEVDPDNLAVLYVPHAPQLSADTDTWDGFSGWEDYVLVSAAIKCLTKDQDDTRALKNELKKIEEDIKINAGYLETGDPKTIRRKRSGLAEVRSTAGGRWRSI